MTIEHKNITDGNIHEPKGASTATVGQIYISDGAGSGTWVDSTTAGLLDAEEGKIPYSDGDDTATWKYPHGGWGFYKDDSAEQSFTTTTAKLSIDGLGSISEESYLPRAIRGSGSLWDTTNDKITPVLLGDSYNLRLDLPVTSRSSAQYLTLELDIGGAATPTIVVVEKRIDCDRSAPFGLSVSVPIFCLSTFLTNGGQVFLKTDAGSVGITAPSILIQQNFSGEQ